MGNYNTMGMDMIEILTYLYKPSWTEINTTRFYVLYLFQWVDLCHTKCFQSTVFNHLHRDKCLKVKLGTVL